MSIRSIVFTVACLTISVLGISSILAQTGSNDNVARNLLTALPGVCAPGVIYRTTGAAASSFVCNNDGSSYSNLLQSGATGPTGAAGASGATGPTGATGTFTGSAWAVQTDAATVTWAIGSAAYAAASLPFTVHSGSRTLNITGLVIGGNYMLKLIQDATGGEGLTLGTGCTWKTAGGGSGAVALTNTANAVDILSFTYDGTNCYATLLPNFN